MNGKQMNDKTIFQPSLPGFYGESYYDLFFLIKTWLGGGIIIWLM